MHRSIYRSGVEIASSLSRVKVEEDRGHVSSRRRAWRGDTAALS